ncbi:MAG TPA: ABC transporter ATP-binding protein [Chitinivibrionales bacterium]|nr:ABC transporter ATP-binding protein [Chitinivibrionales bacterium]
MSQAIISLRGISKAYVMGDTTLWALDGVDLDIHKGEFIAIMGASGSGKSTLMNILGCLDVPTKGTYTLDGIEVQKLPPNELAVLRNRKLGFVFQSFNLLSRTAAIENVELPLLYNNTVSSRESHRRALASLETVGLKERAHHFSNQLSGGQQQRVAIARAIVNDPVLILADEPTGNLDTHMSVEIMSVFQGLNARGITVVIVTHEQDIAQYTKRNVVFRDGAVIADTPVTAPRSAAAELAAAARS